MRIVLMAGGNGTRLWPLSTNNLPKQFIPIFDNEISMLTMTYEKVRKLSDNIYVSTQKKYYDTVLQQTSNSVEVISEPFSNDTFAAFLNIAVYLKYKEKINENEFVAILPTDHDVSNEFYKIIFEAQKLLQINNNSFCLIGIKPINPSTQYGYILHNKFYVNKFVEKPNEAVATELISDGAVWNSGILVFKLGAMLEISKKYFNYNTYQEFINNYAQLPKISFDYEVLEKMNNLMIVVSNEEWKDLGNWYTLYDKLSSPDNYNTNIINKEDRRIINYGVENALIINTMNGMVMYPKKGYQKVIRRWGYYQILHMYKLDNLSIKIKYLKIKPGSNISYQCHNYRNEFWMVVKGSGEVIINGKLKKVKTGDSCFININDKHAIKASETLEIIEVQHGSKTIEEDIERIEYDWDKIYHI